LVAGTATALANAQLNKNDHHNMKSRIKYLSCLITIVCASALIATVGCATAINTKDVTKIVVTTTGVRIGQSQVDKTPELTVGRNQVEYLKVPTGLNATNANASDVTKTAPVVAGYEVNTHSVIFGNAAATSTFATDAAGVSTTLGGQHAPINAGTGLNNPVTGGK
jgi:hypothetical protein